MARFGRRLTELERRQQREMRALGRKHGRELADLEEKHSKELGESRADPADGPEEQGETNVS